MCSMTCGRRAGEYDPAGGSVVGWVMNQARWRAIDRLRFDQRKKRSNGHGEHTAHSLRTSQAPSGIDPAAAEAMTPSSKSHCGQAELVSVYAFRALPSSVVPAREAHIAGCAECRRELETLLPVIDTFADWPTNVLRPSQSLWGRLAQRIGADTGEEPAIPPTQVWAEPEWEEVSPGIFCKLLATDTVRDRVSMLVRLAPTLNIRRTVTPASRSCICLPDVHLLHKKWSRALCE